jgi:hypothetical protein
MNPLIPYAAGLFDGEGCVSIPVLRRPGRMDRLSLRVEMGMTNPEAVLIMRDNFGGSMHTNHHEKRNKNHRPQFTWITGSSNGAKFLRAIQPFSIIKRLEIEVALEFQETIGLKRGGNVDDVIALRHRFRKRLSELKHLSYSLPS